MKVRKLIEINWMILSFLCFLIILFILIFYYIKYPSENAFGERYVKDEIPLIFPFYPMFYLKAMTLIGFLGFLFWCFMLEGLEKLFFNLNKKIIKFLFIIFMLVGIWTFYEIIWNFEAWFTLWEREGDNMDFITITNPKFPFPLNFVVLTKSFFMIFGICVYTLYFLTNISHVKFARRSI